MAAVGTSFEAGVNGVTLSTGDAGSPTPFDVASVGGAATMVYDTTRAYLGTTSARIATGATSQTAYVGWLASRIGTPTTVYGRAYMYLTGVPASPTPFFTALSGTSALVRLRISSGGKMQVRDAGNNDATPATGADTLIPVGQWFRVEWRIVHSTTVGTATISLYNDPTATTATQTFTTAATNTGAASDSYRIGVATAQTAGASIWYDGIAVDSVGFPGPATAYAVASGSAAFTQGSTLTASADVTAGGGVGALSLVVSAATALTAQATVAKRGSGALSAGSSLTASATLVTRSVNVSTSAQLTAALEDAQAGDLIQLADGIYTGTILTTGDGRYNNGGGCYSSFRLYRKNGTPERPITIQGSRDAIIEAGGYGGRYAWYLCESSYITLRGFTSRSGSKGIISDASSHGVYDGLRITDIGDEGLHLRVSSRDNVVRNCEIDHCGAQSAAFGEGLYIGSFTGNWPRYSQGMPDDSSYNLVEGNYFHNNTAEDIDLKETVTGTIIRGNVFDGIGKSGDGPLGAAANSADSNIDLKGTGAIITGNTFKLTGPYTAYVAGIQGHEQLSAGAVGYPSSLGHIISGNTFAYTDLNLAGYPHGVDGYAVEMVGSSKASVTTTNTQTFALSGLSNVTAVENVAYAHQRSTLTADASITNQATSTAALSQTSTLTGSATVVSAVTASAALDLGSTITALGVVTKAGTAAPTTATTMTATASVTMDSVVTAPTGSALTVSVIVAEYGAVSSSMTSSTTLTGFTTGTVFTESTPTAPVFLSATAVVTRLAVTSVATETSLTVAAVTTRLAGTTVATATSLTVSGTVTTPVDLSASLAAGSTLTSAADVTTPVKPVSAGGGYGLDYGASYGTAGAAGGLVKASAVLLTSTITGAAFTGIVTAGPVAATTHSILAGVVNVTTFAAAALRTSTAATTVFTGVIAAGPVAATTTSTLWGAANVATPVTVAATATATLLAAANVTTPLTVVATTTSTLQATAVAHRAAKGVLATRSTLTVTVLSTGAPTGDRDITVTFGRPHWRTLTTRTLGEPVRITRLTRKYVAVEVTAVLNDGHEAVLNGVDVACLPSGKTPNKSTTWTPTTYTAGVATFLVAGPDADPAGAITVPASGAAVWGRVIDTSEVDVAWLTNIDVRYDFGSGDGGSGGAPGGATDGDLDTSGGPRPTIVPWAGVLTRLGITSRPQPAQIATIRTAIEDVAADVQGYLGRAVTPRTYTQAGCWPFPDGWHLDQGDVTSVRSAEPEIDIATGAITGRYTVTYTAGLDVANDPDLGPVRKYITAHALNQPGVVRMWRDAQVGGGKQIKSASTDGQSVSYDWTTPTGAAAGTVGEDVLPPLTSLDRWRVAGRRVFQRAGLREVAGWDY